LLNPLAITVWLPWLSVLAGIALAGAVGLGVRALFWRRLRNARERIEGGLRRLLDLQVNYSLAQLMVGDANDGLLPNLNRLLTAYADALGAALAALREREAALQRDLSEPLSLQQPFLRQPLPGLEDMERSLQEAARGAGERGIHAQLVAADPAHAAQALEHLLAQDVARAQGEPQPQEAHPQYYSLGDLLLNVIGRYTSRLEPLKLSRDLQIERLLHEKIEDYTPRTFLAELRGRTQPLLRWDDEHLARGMPTALEVLALDEPAHSEELAPFAETLKLQPVSSLDPFAITCLRVVHGLRLQAIPHFDVYAGDFRALGPGEQVDLALTPEALSSTGTYLEKPEPARSAEDLAGEEASDV